MSFDYAIMIVFFFSILFHYFKYFEFNIIF